MITLTNFVTILGEEIERIGNIKDGEMSSPPHDDTLLSRLSGLSYQDRIQDTPVDKAISAAGGFAQALERQDLEPKITNEGRLLDEEEEEDDEDKRD